MREKHLQVLPALRCPRSPRPGRAAGSDSALGARGTEMAHRRGPRGDAPGRLCRKKPRRGEQKEDMISRLSFVAGARGPRRRGAGCRGVGSGVTEDNSHRRRSRGPFRTASSAHRRRSPRPPAHRRGGRSCGGRAAGSFAPAPSLKPPPHPQLPHPVRGLRAGPPAPLLGSGPASWKLPRASAAPRDSLLSSRRLLSRLFGAYSHHYLVTGTRAVSDVAITLFMQILSSPAAF